MEAVDLLLALAVLLLCVGLYLAVGLGVALIAAGLAVGGYWVLLDLNDDA